jgi:hypothetical protein
MRKRTRAAVTALIVVVAAAPALGASGSPGAAPKPFTNCKTFNAKYPHGVGRAKARDKTKSKSSDPVTTFKRSTRIYNRAILLNSRLDADKDGVACEKE